MRLIDRAADCARHMRLWVHDAKNVVRHGPGAPRKYELLLVDPQEVERMISWGRANSLGMNASGLVVDDVEWDDVATPVDGSKKLMQIMDHWALGKPWESVGNFRYVIRKVGEGKRVEGCSSMEDVAKRYESLDRMFEHVRREGAFKTQRELGVPGLRGMGEVIMHVGPRGEPIFGGGGFHRLAAAKVLGVKVPAVVGVVDQSALEMYSRLRYNQKQAILRRHAG